MQKTKRYRMGGPATKSVLWHLGFPSKLLSDPVGVKLEGERMIAELKVIEEQMTEWEDSQPLWFLEQLPWWEERKKYRQLKLEGNLPELNWWEVVHWAEMSKPVAIDHPKNWGLYESPPRKARRLKHEAKLAAKALAAKAAS